MSGRFFELQREAIKAGKSFTVAALADEQLIREVQENVATLNGDPLLHVYGDVSLKDRDSLSVSQALTDLNAVLGSGEGHALALSMMCEMEICVPVSQMAKLGKSDVASRISMLVRDFPAYRM